MIETSIGVDMKYPLMSSVDINFGFTQNYILYESDSYTTGNFNNSNTFNYLIDKEDNNWIKGTFGINKQFKNSSLILYYNLSNRSNNIDKWLAFNWNISF